jgi:hypothetical protein
MESPVRKNLTRVDEGGVGSLNDKGMTSSMSRGQITEQPRHNLSINKNKNCLSFIENRVQKYSILAKAIERLRMMAADTTIPALTH